MLFWSPLLLLCKARSPNTLRTPRFSHLESLWRKFNISLIDRSLANGLQAFAGERYTCTRKIPIDDSRSSPPPTVPNPQRPSAGLKCKSKYKKVGVLPIYTQYDVWRFERSFFSLFLFETLGLLFRISALCVNLFIFRFKSMVNCLSEKKLHRKLFVDWISISYNIVPACKEG